MENREFYIDSVIKNEKQKYQEHKNQLLQKLGEYSRGTLVVRESGGRKYCYFRYRDGKRVISKNAVTIRKKPRKLNVFKALFGLSDKI